MKKMILAPLLVFLVLLLILLVYVGFYIWIDAEATVIEVQDGDTFLSSIGWMRLADINTPEKDKPGYFEAKNYLASMIEGEKLFLSVDWYLDPYERQVCLVYIRVDESHIMNVNLKMVLDGFAEMDDHSNKFYPNLWNAYLYYPVFLELFHNITPLLYFLMIIDCVLIAFTISKIIR
jgi:hypothetical protein